MDRLEKLQEVSRTVDELATEHGVESLIWRPDGFLAVMVDADGQSAHAAARFALAVRDRLDGVAMGMHTGPVVAAVVGEARPRFEVWGDGVDGAEALADHAGSGAVLVTPTVRSDLGEAYATEARGVKEIQGRGQMRIFTLVGEASADDAQVAAGA